MDPFVSVAMDIDHPKAMMFRGYVLERRKLMRSRRWIHLDQNSNKFKQFLLISRRRRRRRGRINTRVCSTSKISKHYDQYGEFLLKSRRKRRIMMMRRRKRSRSSTDVSSTSNISKYYYQYGEDSDGKMYGALMWLREEEDEDGYHSNHSNKTLCYKVSVHFMYRLHSGLFIGQKNVSSLYPVVLTGIRSFTDTKYFPVGLATFMIGLGIPESYREAMFRDLSRLDMISSCPPRNDKKITLCMQIKIVTLQLKGEDLLNTRFRCELNGFCRACEVYDSITKETDLEPLHIKDYASSGDMIVEQEEKDQCSICIEELQGCSYILPCSHVYHYDCIFKWVSQNNSCPLCRHAYRRMFPPDILLDPK